MKKESLFHKFLIKIGLIKEANKESEKKRKEILCERAISAEICPGYCNTCAWNTMED